MTGDDEESGPRRGPRPRPGQSGFESALEQQIREAIERGEFDRLAGKGKPLPGIEQPYDELWWVKQKLRDEKLSVLPAALALRRDVESTLAALPGLGDEAAVRERLQGLNARIAGVNATLTAGPASTVAPIDVERVVAGWRQRTGR